jgi:uroporphyrinogen decarboxylase
VHDTPQQVFETAREAIQKAMRGGGFILSSGCALGRDTPPENIEAMARAAMEFGGY